jgi:hypothetical protein
MTNSSINSDSIRTSKFWDINKEIIRGYKLSVTMGFQTPLKYLNLHGVIFDHPSETFDVPRQYGAWTTYLGELKIEGSYASVFGAIKESEADKIVIPFLKEYRLIVESDLSGNKKYEKLNEIGKDNPVWNRYVYLKNLGYPKTLGDLWALENLKTIKGIGTSKAKKLLYDGIYTVEQYGEKAG